MLCYLSTTDYGTTAEMGSSSMDMSEETIFTKSITSPEEPESPMSTSSTSSTPQPLTPDHCAIVGADLSTKTFSKPVIQCSDGDMETSSNIIDLERSPNSVVEFCSKTAKYIFCDMPPNIIDNIRRKKYRRHSREFNKRRINKSSAAKNRRWSTASSTNEDFDANVASPLTQELKELLNDVIQNVSNQLDPVEEDLLEEEDAVVPTAGHVVGSHSPPSLPSYHSFQPVVQSCNFSKPESNQTPVPTLEAKTQKVLFERNLRKFKNEADYCQHQPKRRRLSEPDAKRSTRWQRRTNSCDEQMLETPLAKTSLQLVEIQSFKTDAEEICHLSKDSTVTLKCEIEESKMDQISSIRSEVPSSVASSTFVTASSVEPTSTVATITSSNNGEETVVIVPSIPAVQQQLQENESNIHDLNFDEEEDLHLALDDSDGEDESEDPKSKVKDCQIDLVDLFALGPVSQFSCCGCKKPYDTKIDAFSLNLVSFTIRRVCANCCWWTLRTFSAQEKHF